MERAIARSRAYKLLATAIAYPDDTTWAIIANGGLADALTEAMTAAVGDAPRLALPGGTLQDLQAAYVSAFDLGTGEPHRSLHEGDHLPDNLRPDLLMELQAFYRCFGLSTESCTVGVDHLSVELEFMHYLTFQEANEPMDAPACRRAQRDFIARHLAVWLPPLAAACVGDGFYGQILTTAARLVEADAIRRL